MSNLGELSQIENKIDRIFNGMEVMKEKQIEMAEDISKIKEAVYNPDEGIYARIRELESWKNTSSKLIWMLLTSVIGIITAIILKNYI